MQRDAFVFKGAAEHCRELTVGILGREQSNHGIAQRVGRHQRPHYRVRLPLKNHRHKPRALLPRPAKGVTVCLCVCVRLRVFACVFAARFIRASE